MSLFRMVRKSVNLPTLHSKRAPNSPALRKSSSRKLTIENLEQRKVLAAAVLNEISVDPNGTDQPFEYVEIKGIPGAPATNLYFVSIEGDNPSMGIADLVFDLSSRTFGSNGLIAIVADAAGHSALFDPATAIFVTEAFNVGTGQTLENGTNTWALIHSPTPIVQGTDLDVANNGTLTLPEGAFVVDAIAFTDGGATDRAYAPVLALSGTNNAGAATRFLNDNRANEAAAWYFGDLQAPNSNVLYSTTANTFSPNFPVGGQLTPGAANVPGTNTAPSAVADTYDVEPGSTLTVAVGAGVLANDTDPDGLNSILAARLVSAPTLGTITFNTDGSFEYVSNGTTGVDSFTYQATDLALFSSVVTVTINVEVNTNAPPVLNLPMGPFGFVEGGNAVPISGGATVTDVDSVDFATGFLSVAITTNGEAADSISVASIGTGVGQISVSGSFVQFGGVTIGSLSGGTFDTPLTVSFNSNASLPAVQALVQSIQFANTSEAPSTLTRTLSFVLNDGDTGETSPQLVEVNVAAVNDAPVSVQGRSALTYAVGAGPVTIDGLYNLTDIDSFDFNTGSLTASITTGAHPSDTLAIRNNGTGPGQVGVSGANVLYAGNIVGTLTSPVGSTLQVNFNSTATAEAVTAVARAVFFQTNDARVQPAERVISFNVADGDGGSVINTYSLTQSLARRFAFQEGVDGGQGFYTGVADVQLAQNQPDTNLPIGANPATEGLLVDFDGGSANSQVLLRFDNIFGNGPGQIPLGSRIAAARLVLDTNNPGDGGTFHRLLTSFDANADTWNSFANGVAPRNTTAGVQADDFEARAGFDSQVGVAAGNSDPDAGVTIIGVTADLQAWANGETNHGWMIKGWEGRTDGWAFTASESANAVDRPRLEIDWIPAAISSTSFREGENGYGGTQDTAILESTPDVGSSTAANVFVDANDPGSTNNSQVLLRFDSIIGGLAGQIPAGALIHAAYVDLASTQSNAEGDGGTFHRMSVDWNEEFATWNSFTNGIQADDVEAVANPTAFAGNSDPNALRTQAAGWYSFDVTRDVQAWVTGTAQNYGWAILPYAGLPNGWGVETSEATQPANRPTLRVFYTLPGITVSPTEGLATSEAGGTAQVSVVLNAPPTDTVTIGISSSNTAEGTVSVNELIFTPSNWDVPQIVTITGVDDAIDDGDVAYQIITSPAVSSDPNYNGVNPADVNVVNTDNDNGSATPATVTGVTFGDGTIQRSMVKSIRVDFSQVVTADAGAFVLQRRVGGAWVSIPSTELTINAVDVGTSTQSQFLLTFSGSSVIGGSLADGNYRLTVVGNLISSNGLNLDGDANGSAGGDYVKGAEATDNFFRLFGDFNGTGGVNIFDLNAFRGAVGTNNEVFDFNGVGGVNIFDLNAFRARVGQSRNF